MTEKFLSEETLNVRWTDMDAYSHVAHQSYFNYLTEARHAELIRPFLNEQIEHFILVHIDCQFKKPLVYPEAFKIKQFLVAKGISSFALRFEFYDKTENLVATAASILVTLDPKTESKAPIPAYLKSQFSSDLPTKLEVRNIQIPTDQSPLLTKTVPIRYADIDAFGHVNNTHYFDYMLEARHALFPNGTPLKALCYFFIVDARCQFIRPLHYPGEVHIKIYLSTVNRSSFVFSYEFYQDLEGNPISKGETTLVCIDKVSLKPIAIPEEVLRLLNLENHL